MGGGGQRGGGGALVAQSVKRLTLDFGSGHDVTVCGFKPRVGLCAEDGACLGFSLSLSLSLSLCAPPPLTHSL